MIKELTVRNFRNLNIQAAKLGPGLTVLVGENAQGKTNVLEALYFLAYGKPFRDEKARTINWASDEALIRGVTDVDTIEIAIRRNSENKILVNSKPKGAMSLLGRFVCVIFHPHEIEIVSGAPSLRRAWLDRLISTADKSYLHNLVNYQRALQRKNKLLKYNAPEAQLEVWDKSLAKLGSALWRSREKAVVLINKKLKLEAVKLTGKLIFVEYQNPLHGKQDQQDESFYLKQLFSGRELERRFLATAFGPHRDDFKIILEDASDKNILQKELAPFGSRAEQRQAILLLKLAEAKLFSKYFGEAPTVLLDDVASELDSKNRDLLKRLYARQVIITTTSLDLLPKSVWAKGQVLQMRDGNLYSG